MNQPSNAIKHHGILGMRWGLRRDRGPGGTVSSSASGQAGLRKRKQQKQSSGETISPSARRLGNADSASNQQSSPANNRQSKQNERSTSQPQQQASQERSDFAEAREMQKRGVRNLSTKELQSFTARMDLEQRFDKLTARKPGAVEKFMTDIGRESAKNLASHLITSQGKKLMTSLLERGKG